MKKLSVKKRAQRHARGDDGASAYSYICGHRAARREARGVINELRGTLEGVLAYLDEGDELSIDDRDIRSAVSDARVYLGMRELPDPDEVDEGDDD